MKTDELVFKKVLVTPEMAKELLKGNTTNRPIMIRKLNKYVDDILIGKWKEDTGETIKVSKNNRLIDGQHRLNAVIAANKPIYLHIQYNTPENVFDVIDTGKPRSASDVFFYTGIKNSNKIPSMISTFNLLEAGITKASADNRQSNSQLLEQYYQDDVFWQHVSRKVDVWYNQFSKILQPALIGAFYAHLYQIDEHKAESFMNQLCSGIIEFKPINLLRNRLILEKTSHQKIVFSYKVALIIKTWNYFYNGIEAKVLKFDTSRDDFPVTAGKRIIYKR